MSSERDQILSRVQAALSPLPKRAPLPDWDHELVQMRTGQGTADRWEIFARRLSTVNGTPLTTMTELVSLLERKPCQRGYCDPALWPQLQSYFPSSVHVETCFDRTRVDDYEFGITAAIGAIAETGTLILTDRGTSSRLGALAPWIHIAVLRQEQIHPDIPAALAALPDDPNVIWVTGPSKTADVEGILIEGVHGPGVQAALLIG